MVRPATSDQPTRRWRLVIAYDGSDFHGFAAQPGVRTVAGTLGEALARTARLQGPPPLTCAGRTDTGVHAEGQVVHVDLPAALRLSRRGGLERPMEGPDLQVALNRQLAPEIVVRAAEAVAPGFDARRSAISRTYRYLVWNAPLPNPLLTAVSWHVPDPLDLRAMRSASDAIIGIHDFRAFCRRPPGATPDQPLVRRVHRAQWERCWDARAGTETLGELLAFEIEADSFCHQMVRSLVAAVVEAGRGRANAAVVLSWLRSGTRQGLPKPAPACGLCLVSVSYGDLLGPLARVRY